MVKHFKDITGVLVIGDKPEWYTGEHLPAKDIPGRKEWSIVSKVLKCPHERFLLCSDDVFAQQDFDQSMPMYFSRSLEDARRYAGGQYPDRIRNTMQLYPKGMMFDCHTPMVIEWLHYWTAHGFADWEKREYLNKSIYANSISRPTEHIQDCKIRRGCIVPPLPFFSTSDQTALNVPLEMMYPEPSKYEASL